jgi:hypothetical protein
MNQSGWDLFTESSSILEIMRVHQMANAHFSQAVVPGTCFISVEGPTGKSWSQASPGSGFCGAAPETSGINRHTSWSEQRFLSL